MLAVVSVLEAVVAKLAVLAVLLGACVADDATTFPPDTHRDEANVSIEPIGQAADAQYSEFCELAANLPTTDVCSLVCDPDGFKARLTDSGMKSGNCYQLRCNLSPEVSVTVGVCLP